MNIRKLAATTTLLLFLASGSIALAEDGSHDPYCPSTDAFSQRLAEAVAKSPHHGTPEIGDAVVDLYNEYIVCAAGFLSWLMVPLRLAELG